MSLLSACETLYGLEGRTLHPLVGGVSDHTYALEHASAETLVLRVERAGFHDMPTHEQVLVFLDEQEYPAPRVIRALDGSPAVEYEGYKLVITSYIDGVLVESGANTPTGLYEMGRLIGRLHALDLRKVHLPTADFMPENAVGWAQERLAATEDRLPVAWRYRFDEMLQSLAAVPSLTELPSCLIHNDCHLGNAVCQTDGEVVLIDWDGAGRGAVVLDLGFLLITADTYTPDVPTVGDSDTRVNAIVDGYCEYRCPEDAELERLADAIRFRVTFINAVTFARHIEREEFDSLSTAWWDGCAAADHLANRARRRFEAHRDAGRNLESPARL